MSLNEADWKNVLNQPKNLGLKAGGGTGISKTLDTYQKAKQKLDQSKTVSNATDVTRALQGIVNKCDETIHKHSKLYTTACQYLTGVKREAQEALGPANEQLNELREAQREKNIMDGQKDRFEELCVKTLRDLEGARDANRVTALWKTLTDHISRELPKDFATAYRTVNPYFDWVKNAAKEHPGDKQIYEQRLKMLVEHFPKL
jgi:hypothetical protein